MNISEKNSPIKRLKKFLVLLLTVCMLISMVPAKAMAADTGSTFGVTGPLKAPAAGDVCKIGNTGYPTLEAAFAACPTNASTTIELLKDCTVNSAISWGGNNGGRKITIKPASGVENPTIYRGNVTGDMITIAQGQLEIDDVTINSGTNSATGALIKREHTNNLGTTTLSGVTFLGGDSTGDLVVVTSPTKTRTAPLNMTNCTITMQNATGSAIWTDIRTTAVLDTVTVTGSGQGSAKSLMVFGPYNVTLKDVNVSGHTVSTAGVCAIDASAVTQHVYVEGNTSITGNTAAGNPANLKVSGTGILEIDSGKRLNSTVGVTNTDNSGAGKTFAHLGSPISSKGWHNFKNDLNSDLIATTRLSNVSWKTHRVYNTDPDPSPDSDAFVSVNYPETQTVNVEHDLTIALPLTKTLTLDKPITDAEMALFSDVKFVFDVEVTSGDATGVEKTQYKLPMTTVLQNGTKSGNTYTYKITDWNIKFTKEGAYQLAISESAVESGSNGVGITKDTTTKTLTYNVVENEGFLRVAEVYKAASEDVEAPAVSGYDQEPLSLERLFNVSSVLDQPSTGKAEVTENNGTITLEMSTPNSHAVVAAITTNYSFDFSRSFSVSGQLRMPQEDGFAIAFQSKKNIQAQNREGGYGLDMHNFDTAAGTTQITDYFRNGSTNGNRITASTMEKGFLFVVQNEPISGMASFLIDGATTRIPYPCTNDEFSNMPVIDEYEDHYVIIGSGDMITATDAANRSNAGTAWYSGGAQPYSITFTCTDPSIGKGTLTINVLGHSFEYGNFVAKNVLGDAWREAYFVVGTAEDNTASATVSILDSHYTDGIASVASSFWADRDGDGLFETQVNTTNSLAIPGETILVRHDMVSTEPEGFDHDYYIKTLITQLKDVTSNTELTGISGSAVSWVEGSTTAIKAKDESSAAYNTEVLSDGMFVAPLKDNQHTFFEYKVTAPTQKGHTVIESALFGEPPFATIYTPTIGFKTENITEQSATLNNSAEIVRVTYNPAGGTFADDTTANKVVPVLKGSTFVPSEEPTKADWDFAGWKLEGSDTIYQTTDSFTVNSDVTLIAQWTQGHDLTITKKVTGDFADMTKSFEIKITANAVTEAKSFTATKGGSSTTVAFNANGEATVSLKNNETITINKLPVGQVTISEDLTGTGYTDTYKVKVGDAAETTNATFNLSADTTVEVTNTFANITPTGISMNNIGIWIGMAAVVLAGLYIYRTKKRGKAA